MALTLKQLNELKSFYVERIVDNMSTRDLVNYVMDDMTDYVQKLGEHEFINEAKNYFDDGYKEVVEEVKEIHPVAGQFS
jgi:hypothetical protein